MNTLMKKHFKITLLWQYTLHIFTIKRFYLENTTKFKATVSFHTILCVLFFIVLYTNQSFTIKVNKMWIIIMGKCLQLSCCPKDTPSKYRFLYKLIGKKRKRKREDRQCFLRDLQILLITSIYYLCNYDWFQF